MSKVDKKKVISELTECVNHLDKIIDDVMELESKKLDEPMEKLVLRTDELISYNIFCSMNDLKSAIVKLVGGSDE